MFIKGLLKGLGITAKHTFEREITQQYPEERPSLQNRYRGNLEYDYPKCIACGLCVKACPNQVLILDTVKDETSKKKRVDKFTIDLQYCLFCNLCVEVCPTDTLYFTKDFELTQTNRDSIVKVYRRPPGLALSDGDNGSVQESQPNSEASGDDLKRLKQTDAIKSALHKNPSKALAKVLPTEEDIDIMIGIINDDDKKLSKLAELMVEDRDKATKVAQAWINRAKQNPTGKKEA